MIGQRSLLGGAQPALSARSLAPADGTHGRHRPGSGKPSDEQSLECLITIVGQIATRLQTLEVLIHDLRSTAANPSLNREWYTTAEAAVLAGKAEYTVRQWCRERRIHAVKAESGRGINGEWRIARKEIERFLNCGLLPKPKWPQHAR